MATTGTSTTIIGCVEWSLSRIHVNKMKSYKNLYDKLCNIQNLILAWRRARKHKARKFYVMEFESKIRENLFQLREE
jgi:hypothetical protein